MSNRRHSIMKLSKRLRILEDDLVVFLSKNGLQQKSNTHGITGFDPDDIKSFLSSMSTLARNEMFLLKTRWEQEQENNRKNLFIEDYLSVEEAATLFEAPVKKMVKFLENNNVPKVVKNGYIFWDAETILRIKTAPSKKQYIDLNKLRKQQKQAQHVNDVELAEMFNVDETLVSAMKRYLCIENVHPLTRETVLDIVSDYSFAAKKQRFLTKEKHKTGNRTNIISIETDAEEVKNLDGIPVDKMFSAPDAASILGVSPKGFRKFVKDNNVQPSSQYTNEYKQKVNLFSYATIHSLKDNETVATMKIRSSRAKDRIKRKNEAIRTEKETILNDVKNNVLVRVRDRTETPLTVTLYTGPTNSGKTYNSLQQLFKEYEDAQITGETGVFVYAGPLRMLAFEVYQKMVERYGEEKVGFLTGEEQINPEAQLLAATTEMAPEEGHSLVLDEAHWIVEPARGHNWTNLLVGGKYKHFHILTAQEAKNTIKTLMEDAYHIEERKFTRKTPILFAGAVNAADVEAKTAVICFSRKMVYRVAKILQQQTDLNVGVLYGALPLIAREKQIQDFVDGKIDIMVTTDVIGHGINLPLDNIVYTETTKFDGRERRELHLWEAAQISGRAGRYGLSEQGKVQILNLGWNKTNYSLVRDSAQAAAGKIGTNLKVTDALIAPKFGDLGVTDTDKIMLALEQWGVQAEEKLANRTITPAELMEKKELLETIGSKLSTPIYPWDINKDERNYSEGLQFGERKRLYPAGRALNSWKVKPEEIWQLISGPFDSDLPTIGVIAGWLQDRKPENVLQEFFKTEVVEKVSILQDIEDLEKISRTISELKMVTVIFENTELNIADLQHYEEIVGNKIVDILSEEVENNTYGTCENCGGECLPWFNECKNCAVQSFTPVLPVVKKFKKVKTRTVR